jgi:putative FmdB family regulatory protein
MPIYEYRCEDCGAKEEKLQPISAPEVHACPTCGLEAGMKRQISVAGFMLSGGGWYAQGYGEGKGAEGKASGSVSVTPAPEAAAPSGACAGGCACHSAVVQKATEKAG